MVFSFLHHKKTWQVWAPADKQGFDATLERMATLFTFLKTNWTFLVAIFTPFVLIIVPATWEGGHSGKEAYGAYIILLMSTYFMTECVPLPVTALLPVLLFPLFGIASTGELLKIGRQKYKFKVYT